MPWISSEPLSASERLALINQWEEEWELGGTGIVGFTGGAGAYGGEFFGGLAEVRLRPGGAAPITLTNAHQVGEMYEDQDETLDVVPVKDTAVALTVTVTETEGTGGFVAVRPAGTAYNARRASTGSLRIRPSRPR